ncbi:hypothetical protein QO010_000664 [Caulobacter ginsengisoli]|uniref:DUF995 domain-containing protein n=1 Tax=Caulobacter ginsengisoli TaxID=400775 RepID=A0ABU0INE4_9CAUL|nr:hypothetical protein [Caulobacter ginsengisoli]MDQ0462916.1 hypothetical protein [Caulobacter ginsengisoli]
MIRRPARHLLLTIIALSLALPAFALTRADLEPAFKNTVVTTYPSGRTARLWLNRDGTYDATRTNGERTSGTWQIKGDKICMTQDKPFHFPLSLCTIVPKGGVGTSWASKSIKGEPVRNTLVAGR